MTHLKIGILTPYYVPVKGGISSYVYNLVLTLNIFDFNTIVIARYGDINENVFIVNNKIYFIIKSYLILCEEKPNIIHAHSNWYTLATSVIYKTIHPKTRIVFTFHTEPLDEMKGSKRIMFQWLLSKCDVVTCVSRALMEKIENNFELKNDKKVIYAGVSKKKVSGDEVQEFKKKYSLENNGPIISFIGPLVWKQKVEGVKILIKSFKIIEAECPDSKLLIIGDGMYKKELQQLTDKLNINNVIFTGFLDNVFVPLSVTNIYAHISLQEGFPISLLEAMGMEKPVIATKIGGIPEIIVDGVNGILVEPDSTKIADQILKLYDDKEKCRNIAKEAISTVQKEYNWIKITENFINIY